jgi:hypothetical protein
MYGDVLAVTVGRLARGKAFIQDDSRSKSRAEGDQAMKQIILVMAILMFACAAGAGPEVVGKPLKLVIERHSTVPMVEVVKNFGDKCPNVTITTNVEKSDYMLQAIGWPGDGYRFMVIGKGGDSLYATKTVLLSNAVKDVCHFLNTRP